MLTILLSKYKSKRAQSDRFSERVPKKKNGVKTWNKWFGAIPNIGAICLRKRVFRVGNLAFLRPNNSSLAFLFLVWPWKKYLAFWLYFGSFLSSDRKFFAYRIIQLFMYKMYNSASESDHEQEE